MNQKEKTIIVLGPARSGTSVTTGILNILGVYIGEKIVGGNPDNPKGSFEDVDFFKLDKSIFYSAAKTKDWANPPTKKQVLEQKEIFKNEIKNLILKKNNKNKIWGWKVPTTCLTIDLYLPYLNNPYFIIVRRDLKDIAKSAVSHRSELNYEEMIKNAEFYYKNINDFLNKNPKLPRISVFFKNIIKNPILESKKIADFIGLDFSETKKEKIQEFIIPRKKIKQAKLISKTRFKIKKYSGVLKEKGLFALIKKLSSSILRRINSIFK